MQTVAESLVFGKTILTFVLVFVSRDFKVHSLQVMQRCTITRYGGVDRCAQARREGEKGGKFSRAPRRFGVGAPPSLKNTENVVPGGFFLT